MCNQGVPDTDTYRSKTRIPSARMGYEDCLIVNVYTAQADSSESVPVLVWFHGGGLASGEGGMYSPHFLIDYGLVIVTVNYRLGPWGELSLDSPTISGNQGLRDQTLALQWVQNNIQYFGGDPAMVRTTFEDLDYQNIPLGDHSWGECWQLVCFPPSLVTKLSRIIQGSYRAERYHDIRTSRHIHDQASQSSAIKKTETPRSGRRPETMECCLPRKLVAMMDLIGMRRWLSFVFEEKLLMNYSKLIEVELSVPEAASIVSQISALYYQIYQIICFRPSSFTR